MLVWNTADTACKSEGLNIFLLLLEHHVENSASFQKSSLQLWIILCTFWAFIVKVEKEKYKFHNFKRFNYLN